MTDKDTNKEYMHTNYTSSLETPGCCSSLPTCTPCEHKRWGHANFIFWEFSHRRLTHCALNNVLYLIIEFNTFILLITPHLALFAFVFTVVLMYVTVRIHLTNKVMLMVIAGMFHGSKLILISSNSIITHYTEAAIFYSILFYFFNSSNIFDQNTNLPVMSL